MRAIWTKIVEHERMKRSSHTAKVHDGTVFVFGGELQPRTPRDAVLYGVTLHGPDGKDEASSPPCRSIYAVGTQAGPRGHDADEGRCIFAKERSVANSCSRHSRQRGDEYQRKDRAFPARPGWISCYSAQWTALHVWRTRRRGHGATPRGRRHVDV